MNLPPRPLRWLFLDLNAYFASVEQQVRPELRGKPVIIAPAGVETTVAIAASYEAKAYGISTLTPVWEARKRCPDIQVVSPRHELYVEYHNRIIAEIEWHIPVTKVCSIDEVACRLLDNENDEAGVRALAARIKAGIRDNVGDWLRCSIGIAPNRVLAKLASDMMKPDGLVVLQAHELPQRLYSLPLTAIAGIGAKMKARLAKAGVNDIEQLCARRPLDAGTAWGGRDGDRLWYALHGVDLPDKATQERTVGHSHVLAPKNRGRESARLVARRLVLKAASRLRAKNMTAALLILHVRFEPDANGVRGKWHASIKLPATQDSFRILASLDALWPQLVEVAGARPGGFRLRMVGVTLAGLSPVGGEQGSLFERLDPGHELARSLRTEALSRAMDRLNTRFGRNAVMLGPQSGGRADRIGTSIAFGRIPEAADFTA
ncbi:type VI secretion protein ImpB [Sphingomonas sp. SUN039]|uniref:Y-family DNA polymerase n=1 Tax=Sphingomonas sp. SUN039 TaxID=2937787 RepID=UPI002164DEC0|nr:type VI secretion protein ImpB [Sphingomonas sp. SUN039]UVO54485.1 type VI secretion protein ImpB [Sphingomonas sp. SUN039]